VLTQPPPGRKKKLHFPQLTVFGTSHCDHFDWASQSVRSPCLPSLRFPLHSASGREKTAPQPQHRRNEVWMLKLMAQIDEPEKEMNRSREVT
jgi:hypothetical protein